MPELPEVEVVRRGLQKILEDQPVIEKIQLMRPDLREPMPTAKKLKQLHGHAIMSIERRAKYLLLWTSQGALISHLGMTGTWRTAPAGTERDHDHVYIHFANGLRLAYRDPRRFGIFDFSPEPYRQPRFQLLGPEPLEPSFTGASLWQSLRKKDGALKVALMDQRVVVGVGNIYASEALFSAGIRPNLAASKLSQQRAEVLVAEIKKILTLSIEKGGSSISDFAQASGDSGYFQNTFRVYGRDGEGCLHCTRQIKSAVLGGRNTFWCPSCQS